ncbi:Putative transmembrane protein [hydrothermal vent metagenome]|uniref:Transmembrane protein n=1 Tax=hydrothermal vent metagenome TaxID=652676 RepID=A0A3B0Z3D4_9ZZZZ
MTKRVLIIGGYGNFGRYISATLASEPDITIIIAGRNPHKAEALARTLDARNIPETAKLDIQDDLSAPFKQIAPDIVIHTSGPYQSQGYEVALACIAQGCHYIDLADAREFVSNIQSLDQAAKDRGVLLCSGASSVPSLTGAIIDAYIGEFNTLESIDYAIASAQLTNQGLATTAAVLSYAGKSFKTLIDGQMTDVYGWQGLRLCQFWKLNTRMLGNCNVPDLEIFPKRYPSLKTIRFQAGIELKIQHLGLVLLSWLVRLKILTSVQPLAPYLLKISRAFDIFGKDDSGFYMTLSGLDDAGHAKNICFEIAAHKGDGLYIPSFPSILMAKKLARGEVTATGAQACVGFITLSEYLAALEGLDIQWRTEGVADNPQ